jgi:hypothetical protein
VIRLRIPLTALMIAMPLAACAADESPPAGVVSPSASQPGVSPESAPETAPSTSPVPQPASPAPAAPAASPEDPVADFIARAGYWAVMSSGSPVKVGEYQNLQSSPFWDVDGIFSNGKISADVTATGTDDESTAGHLNAYLGPQLSGTLDYQRFPYQLVPHNFSGFQASPVAAENPNNATYTDFSPGQDYAFRIQELKANFKGFLMDNVKWHVNVFGLEKEGTRQANTLTHCFNAGNTLQNECHAVSNSQHIDWKTTEVEPGIEVRFLDGLTVDYSHTIRTFQQQDRIVTNDYTASGANGFPDPNNPNPNATSIAGYAFVPDSTTNIDRIKIRRQFEFDTDVYAVGFVGDTYNQFRQTDRRFGGADVRLTNSSLDGLTVTAYGKCYSENTDLPSTPLDTLYPSMANLYQEFTLANVPLPVDRTTDSAGINLRWRPFHGDGDLARSSLAFTAGYDFSQVRWSNVSYTITGPTGGTFIQPNSNANTFSLGIEHKWSRRFSSYVRYKRIDNYYPLLGVTAGAYGGVDAPSAIVNTNLPTAENRVEIGGTWTPVDTLMFNGTFYVENAMNHGPYAYFDSNSFPFVLSSWYSPTPDWSLSFGYADFMDWITQDVTLGSTGGDAQGTPAPAFTAPWRYSAKTDVINLGTRYACTKELTLRGDFEYVNGLNSVNVTPTPAGAVSYSNPSAPDQPLGSYSLASVRTFRFSAGMDYLIRPRMTTYFRYNYFDFADLSTGLTSGQAHMLLGGLSAVF